MLIPGNYSDIRSAIHMDTPIQLGTGVDGKVYYSVLLESETDPAGEWSDGKALTFADGFREIGSEVIVPVGPYLGLAGASDYVDAGTMAQAPDTTAATYEAWIKTTAKHSQTIVMAPVGTGGAVPCLSVQADRLSVYWGPGESGGASVPSVDTTPISDGRWHHVALVCDQGDVRFYKDGVPTQDATLEMPYAESGATVLQIGPGFGSSQSFDGEIAEVRAWSLARSTEQIQAAMSVQLTGSEEGLVAYCSLSGGAVDNVVNNSTGQLHGNAHIVTPTPATALGHVFSDEKYFYVFRAFTDGAVYAHRFVLDIVNGVLNQPYEARRRPDGTYGWMDLNHKPYPEPATRISPLDDVADARFCVLQAPTSRQGINRWHFFSCTSTGIRHLSLRRDDRGLFDPRDVTLSFCPSDSAGKPSPPEPFTVPGTTDESFTLANRQVVGAPAAATFYKHDTVTDSSQTYTLRTYSHVLLALPTSAPDADSAIAALDFEVAKDGTLAQTSGVVTLPTLGGTSLQMPVLGTDPRTLVTRGGALTFAQSSDPACVIDSADGFVHLFYRDPHGLSLAAFYDTVDCQWVNQGSGLAPKVRNDGDWVSDTVKTAIRDAELLFVTPQENCAYTIWRYDPEVTGFRPQNQGRFPGRPVIAGMNAGIFPQDYYSPKPFTHVCPLDGGRVLFCRFAASVSEYHDDMYEIWQYDPEVAAGFRDGSGFPGLPFPGQKIVSGTSSGVFTAPPLVGYDVDPTTLAYLGGNRLLFYSPYNPSPEYEGGTYAVWEYDPSITGNRDGRAGQGFPGKLVVSGIGAGVFADSRMDDSPPTWVVGVGGSRVLFMGKDGEGGYAYEIWQYDPTQSGWRDGSIGTTEGFPGSLIVSGSRTTDIFGGEIANSGTPVADVMLITPGRLMFYNPTASPYYDADGVYEIWQYDPSATGFRYGAGWHGSGSDGFPGTLIVSGDGGGWFSGDTPGMPSPPPPDQMPRSCAFVCSLGPARIQGSPGVIEQGSVATDDSGKPIVDGSGNLTGEMARWYADRAHLTAFSASRIKVDDLQLSLLGMEVVDQSLLGYIEGAPPLPLENMTEQSNYDGGGSPGYVGSSIFFQMADGIENMWSWDRDRGLDFELKMEAGGGVFGTSNKAKAQIDTKYGWLDSREEASTFQYMTTRSITQKGYTANGRWLPYNYGMAFLSGLTANVYCLRLKGSDRIVGYQLVLSDAQPTVQEIRFPINPRYTKQGTLDGRIGLNSDPDYPNAAHEASRVGNSYYKPDESEAFESAIEREAAQREAFYTQYNANAFATLTDDDKTAMTQRSLVDTVQWQAPGGQQVIDEDVTTTSQTSSGGSFSFLGMAGGSVETGLQLPLLGSLSVKVSVMVGGHLDLTVRKTQQSTTNFHVTAYADCDQDVVQAPAGTKVQRYEFKTFYLEEDAAHFDDFFTRVIDPDWLSGKAGDNADVNVFREVINRSKPCWRILHRVTEIDRGDDGAKRVHSGHAGEPRQRREQIG